MLNVLRILVSARSRRAGLAALMLGGLAGCGQKGPLYLPSDAAAPGRLTLPQTLNPAAAPAPAPTTGPVTGPATGTGTAEPIPGQ